MVKIYYQNQSLKIGKNAKNDEKSQNSCFLPKIDNFYSLISVANMDQNTTCYSVLEMVEYEQQSFGQFVVIYSTCQKLLVKNQTEGPGIKIGRFRSTISNS